MFLDTTAPGASMISFAGRQTFDAGAMPIWVGLIDATGNGKPDIIAANSGSASVSVLANSQYHAVAADSMAIGTIASDEVFANGFE